MNLKIRIYEKSAPLTLVFSYPSNPSIKGVQLFYSQNIKEPKRQQNHGYQLLSSNPTKIKIQGVIDPRTGK